MGKAKEELNKNINKVLNGENISREALARNFYAYIEERIKEWTKFTKQIKSDSWFGPQNSKLLTTETARYKLYKNILKKLKKNKNYIPQPTEATDASIKSYRQVRIRTDWIHDCNIFKEFKEFCNKIVPWNDEHIKQGPYKKFINGLINYLLDDLEKKYPNYYNHQIDIGSFTVESTLEYKGVPLLTARKIRTLFEEYVHVTEEELYKHLIEVSNLKTTDIKKNLDTLLNEYAVLKNEEKNDKLIINKLKELSYQWYQTSGFKSRFYKTLDGICSDTENLNTIMKKIFIIKSVCMQMQ